MISCRTTLRSEATFSARERDSRRLIGFSNAKTSHSGLPFWSWAHELPVPATPGRPELGSFTTERTASAATPVEQ